MHDDIDDRPTRTQVSVSQIMVNNRKDTPQVHSEIALDVRQRQRIDRMDAWRER